MCFQNRKLCDFFKLRESIWLNFPRHVVQNGIYKFGLFAFGKEGFRYALEQV